MTSPDRVRDSRDSGGHQIRFVRRRHVEQRTRRKNEAQRLREGARQAAGGALPPSGLDQASGARVIVVLEGRDAAGKGGTIKAITEKVSPRVFRVVALPAPSDREKSQMYMQRYIERFPAGGEIVIFDRSWYNRAGVEYVMGFCSTKQHKRFLELCPIVEKFIIDGGILLHQDLARGRRGGAGAALQGAHRRSGPPVEAEPDGHRIVRALVRLFPGARHDVRVYRHQHAPWYIVHSDDKKRARLNGIAHILSQIPYKKVDRAKVKLPARSDKKKYDDQASIAGRRLAEQRY